MKATTVWATALSSRAFRACAIELVTSQIQQETQAQGGANAQLASLQQIQPTFTTSTQDIGTQMSALFASISESFDGSDQLCFTRGSTHRRGESGPGFQPNFHHVDRHSRPGSTPRSHRMSARSTKSRSRLRL